MSFMVATQEDADGPGIAAIADRLLVECSGLAVLRMPVQLDDQCVTELDPAVHWGTVGSAAARLLAQREGPVRVMVRDPQQATSGRTPLSHGQT
jgi:hypothetical protein